MEIKIVIFTHEKRSRFLIAVLRQEQNQNPGKNKEFLHKSSAAAFLRLILHNANHVIEVFVSKRLYKVLKSAS